MTAKIKSIIAIVEIDGVEQEVGLSELHSFSRTFALEKIFQPANPMAPGSESLYGVSLKISTVEPFSLDPEYDDKEDK